MADYQYTVYFEPLPGGGYNVVVPAMPEICTSGRTLEEARAMAKDAKAANLSRQILFPAQSRCVKSECALRGNATL